MIEQLKEPPRHWLDLDLCERLYKALSKSHHFDQPLPEFETRFEGRLESILGSVKQSFENTHANPTLLDATTSYFFQLAEGHAFINGNKRLAVLFTHVFLLKNGLDFTVSTMDLYKTAVEVVELSRTESIQIIKKALKEYFSYSIQELSLEW